jgi:hypothetical protein
MKTFSNKYLTKCAGRKIPEHHNLIPRDGHLKLPISLLTFSQTHSLQEIPFSTLRRKDLKEL